MHELRPVSLLQTSTLAFPQLILVKWWQRIIAKAVLRIVKLDIVEAVGPLQLCAGQDAAVYTMRTIFSDSSNCWWMLSTVLIGRRFSITCALLFPTLLLTLIGIIAEHLSARANNFDTLNFLYLYLFIIYIQICLSALCMMQSIYSECNIM